LLVGSFLFMLLCRSEILKKIKLFERHYKQISDRYDKLLCKNELQKVFEDCNPNIDESHSSILQSRMRWITWIWGLIVFVFGIAVVVLFFIAE
jgi:hypothetical protein